MCVYVLNYYIEHWTLSEYLIGAIYIYDTWITTIVRNERVKEKNDIEKLLCFLTILFDGNWNNCKHRLKTKYLFRKARDKSRKTNIWEN